jgi:hypothetical protein
MPRLNEVIKPLVQRTLANEYTTAAATDPSNFSSRGASSTKASNQGLSADIANLVFQWNRVGYVLFNSLPSADGINALDFGLAGNAIYTHVNANAASNIALNGLQLEIGSVPNATDYQYQISANSNFSNSSFKSAIKNKYKLKLFVVPNQTPRLFINFHTC